MAQSTLCTAERICCYKTSNCGPTSNIYFLVLTGRSRISTASLRCTARTNHDAVVFGVRHLDRKNDLQVLEEFLDLRLIHQTGELELANIGIDLDGLVDITADVSREI